MFSNFAVPSLVYGVQRLRVLESGPGRLGAYGSCIFLIGVEGRVEVDQVYRLRIHAPHYVQVVTCPHRPVGPVGFTHSFSSLFPCFEYVGEDILTQ